MSSDDRQPSAGLVSSTDTENLTAGPSLSLARRLTFALFVAAFAMSLLASGILYWAMLATLQYANDQVIDKRADTVIDILTSKELNDGLLAHEVNEDNQGPRQIFMRVVSTHEPIRLATEGMEGLLSAPLFPDARSAPPLSAIRQTIELPDGRIYRAASYKVPVSALPAGTDAILQVATDTSLDKVSLEFFRKILLSVIGAALPLSALVSYYIVLRNLKPLGRITAAARRIDGGTLDQRIALSALPAELHELGLQFNSMLGRLEETWLDLKHYADTIAHELRTPLNRMRLECEIALDKVGSVDEFRNVMSSAVAECERLTQLLQGLLFLARVDSRQASIAPRAVELRSFLNNIHDYFDAEAVEKQITLIATCEKDLTIEVDKELFQQAIANLLSNAISHTPKGGEIAIEASCDDKMVNISVRDSGIGISAENQAHVFDRFYRAKTKSNSSNDSAKLGLGLHIVKGIVELHGGTVGLTSAPGKGTCVTISVPRIPAPGLLQAPAPVRALT